MALNLRIGRAAAALFVLGAPRCLFVTGDAERAPTQGMVLFRAASNLIGLRGRILRELDE